MRNSRKITAILCAALLITMTVSAITAFAGERLFKPLSQVLSDLRLERHVAAGGDPEEAPEATLDNSYGLIVYASGDGDVNTVAYDLEGRPILVGMSARGIVARLGVSEGTFGGGGLSWMTGPFWTGEGWTGGFKTAANCPAGYNNTISVTGDGKIFFIADVNITPSKQREHAIFDPSTGEILFLGQDQGLLSLRGRSQSASDGTLWFIPTDGFGSYHLASLDPSTGQITVINGFDDIDELMVDANDIVWFSDLNNDYKLTWYNPANGTSGAIDGTDAYQMAQDPSRTDTIWFTNSLDYCRLSTYNKSTGILEDVRDVNGDCFEAYQTSFSADGTLWYIDEDDGLSRFNPILKTRTQINIPAMAGVEPFGLTVDDAGNIWFGNSADGSFCLMKYSPETEGLTTFPGHTIFTDFGMVMDSNGNLWFMDKDTHELVVYSPHN